MIDEDWLLKVEEVWFNLCPVIVDKVRTILTVVLFQLLVWVENSWYVLQSAVAMSASKALGWSRYVIKYSDQFSLAV